MSPYRRRVLATLAFFAALTATAASAQEGKVAPVSQSALESFRPYAVTLSVTDLEGTARWYREKLGFQEVKRKSYPEFATSLVFLEKNGFQVELIRDENARADAPRPDPPAHTSRTGVSQFAFETDDLAAVRAALEARRVAIVWQFENADLGVRFLFVRDPEGTLIQFIERLR